MVKHKGDSDEESFFSNHLLIAASLCCIQLCRLQSAL